MEETVEDRAVKYLERYTRLMHRARSEYTYLEYTIDDVVRLLECIVGK